MHFALLCRSMSLPEFMGSRLQFNAVHCIAIGLNILRNDQIVLMFAQEFYLVNCKWHTRIFIAQTIHNRIKDALKFTTVSKLKTSVNTIQNTCCACICMFRHAGSRGWLFAFQWCSTCVLNNRNEIFTPLGILAVVNGIEGPFTYKRRIIEWKTRNNNSLLFMTHDWWKITIFMKFKTAFGFHFHTGSYLIHIKSMIIIVVFENRWFQISYS